MAGLVLDGVQEDPAGSDISAVGTGKVRPFSSFRFEGTSATSETQTSEGGRSWRVVSRMTNAHSAQSQASTWSKPDDLVNAQE